MRWNSNRVFTIQAPVTRRSAAANLHQQSAQAMIRCQKPHNTCPTLWCYHTPVVRQRSEFSVRILLTCNKPPTFDPTNVITQKEVDKVCSMLIAKTNATISRLKLCCVSQGFLLSELASVGKC